MGSCLWSQEEIDALKTMWPLFAAHKIGNEELITGIAGSVVDAIIAKASNLGLPTARPGRVDTGILAKILKEYKL